MHVCVCTCDCLHVEIRTACKVGSLLSPHGFWTWSSLTAGRLLYPLSHLNGICFPRPLPSSLESQPLAVRVTRASWNERGTQVLAVSVRLPISVSPQYSQERHRPA